MASKEQKDGDFEIPDFYDEPILKESKTYPLKKFIKEYDDSLILPDIETVEENSIDRYPISNSQNDGDSIIGNPIEEEKAGDYLEASPNYQDPSNIDDALSLHSAPDEDNSKNTDSYDLADENSEEGDENDGTNELLALLEDLENDFPDDDNEENDNDNVDVSEVENTLPQEASKKDDSENSEFEENQTDFDDDDLLAMFREIDSDEEETPDSDTNSDDGDDSSLSEDELLSMLKDLEDSDAESEENLENTDKENESLNNSDLEISDEESDGDLSEEELLKMLSDLESEEEPLESDEIHSNENNQDNDDDSDEDEDYDEDELMAMLSEFGDDSDEDDNNEDDSEDDDLESLLNKATLPKPSHKDDDESDSNEDELISMLDDDSEDSDWFPPENSFGVPSDDEDDEDDGPKKVSNKNGESKSLLAKIFYPYTLLCNYIYKGIISFWKLLGKLPAIGKTFIKLSKLDTVWRAVSYIIPILVVIIIFMALSKPGVSSEDATIKIPDNGSITMTDYSYDYETSEVQAKLINNGDVTALITPTILVSGADNTTKGEAIKCSNKKGVLIKVGQEEDVSIKCSVEGKNLSFSGILEWNGN